LAGQALDGISDHIHSPVFGIEVHFRIAARRNMPLAPVTTMRGR